MSADKYQVLQGDALEQLRTLPDESVNCCVTSPPYFGLRDYGVVGQIGLEPTPAEFVAKLVEVFREVRRVLRDDGTAWVNLGDSYARGFGGGSPGAKSATNAGSFTSRKAGKVPDGLSQKDLIGVPWRFALAAQADGWCLRQDIIWHKPNPMPESVTDRCTKAHEYIFLLSKSPRYYFDADAIKEPAVYAMSGRASKKRGEFNDKGQPKGREPFRAITEFRNRRSVWTVSTKPYKGAHFATFPPDLIRPCILAGCPQSGKRCDCDEIIHTPTGQGETIDPTMVTGRAGMDRVRKDGEGTRPITRREQRWEAGQIRSSPHREQIEMECGQAFDHYVRTDKSGARPLPEHLRAKYLESGWITEAPPCECPVEDAGVVLDPFAGSGTTLAVAIEEERRAIGIELNPDYIPLIHQRVSEGAKPTKTMRAKVKPASKTRSLFDI